MAPVGHPSKDEPRRTGHFWASINGFLRVTPGIITTEPSAATTDEVVALRAKLAAQAQQYEPQMRKEACFFDHRHDTRQLLVQEDPYPSVQAVTHRACNASLPLAVKTTAPPAT